MDVYSCVSLVPTPQGVGSGSKCWRARARLVECQPWTSPPSKRPGTPLRTDLDHTTFAGPDARKQTYIGHEEDRICHFADARTTVQAVALLALNPSIRTFPISVPLSSEFRPRHCFEHIASCQCTDAVLLTSNSISFFGCKTINCLPPSSIILTLLSSNPLIRLGSLQHSTFVCQYSPSSSSKSSR